MNPVNDLTINRTPAPGCPACEYKRRHTVLEFKLFHPLAGTSTPAQSKAPEAPAPAVREKAGCS